MTASSSVSSCAAAFHSTPSRGWGGRERGSCIAPSQPGTALEGSLLALMLVLKKKRQRRATRRPSACLYSSSTLANARLTLPITADLLIPARAKHR